MAKILALGGDGIGPEILNEGLRVLAAVSPLMDLEFEIDHDLLHGASYDAHGVFCTDAVLAVSYTHLTLPTKRIV